MLDDQRDLYKLTATELGPLFSANKLTVEAYVTSLLARIQNRQPTTKAWVHFDQDLVLTRARELDSLPPSARGPLHGIPIGIKDTMLTRDMPTQYNSPIYENATPSGMDASIVRILRASGAVILGKTTTTEFAATTEGNIHQNLTLNAHDETRTPGGSSSGSAVAVADFQVPIAVGSQTGGSIVRPASFNGIWGIKFTWGAVSTEGVAQHSVTCDTLGVFGRCLDDLELVANVLRVGNKTQQMNERLTATNGVRGAKIGFCRTHVWKDHAKPGMKKVWEEAKAALSAAGAVVEEFELPEEFANITRWHGNVLVGEGRGAFLGAYLSSKDKLARFLGEYVENVQNVSDMDLLEAHDGCAKLRPVWDDIATKYDAILTPSVPGEAPVGLHYTGSASFNAMWTILHAPSINIPSLLADTRMPVGLTLVDARYRDREALRKAREIGAVLAALS